MNMPELFLSERVLVAMMTASEGDGPYRLLFLPLSTPKLTVSQILVGHMSQFYGGVVTTNYAWQAANEIFMSLVVYSNALESAG